MIVYSPMGSGLLTGAMTHERVGNLAAVDWRRGNPEFQEPKLSRNLAWWNGSGLSARVTASPRAKSPSPGRCEIRQSPARSSVRAMPSRSTASLAPQVCDLRRKKLPRSKRTVDRRPTANHRVLKVMRRRIALPKLSRNRVRVFGNFARSASECGDLAPLFLKRRQRVD